MQFIRKIRKYGVLSGADAHLHLFIDYESGKVERTFSLYHEQERPAHHHSIDLDYEYLKRSDEAVTINIGRIVRRVMAEIE
jgi:hypothetical protein